MDKSKTNRSNTWTFCVYPGDSLPENYIEIINSWHLPVLMSPPHNKDKNGDQTEKKKHIHIMIYFGVGQNKSFNQVQQFSNQLGGCAPIIVHNTNAMIRYFIHKDNPEKHQYPIDQLQAFAGFEWKQAFENFTTDQELYCHIEEIIKKEVFYNLTDLEFYLKSHNEYFEYAFVRSHINYFMHYLSAVYRKVKMKS